MADEPIKDITTATTLKQIQSQLAVLETSYADLIRTYYNMFYNPTPMDISIKIYNDDGELETITVPNRAKDNTATVVYNGSPEGVLEATLGTICLDKINKTLWYKTEQYGTSGWKEIKSDANWENGIDYLKPNGDGSLLTNLNMNNVSLGILPVANGGTHTGSIEGIVKAVPTYTDEQGRIVPAHFEAAIAGTDFMNTSNLAGMIVYFTIDEVPAGYLLCNGDGYSKTTYSVLYNYLSKGGTQACPYGETDDMFFTPDLTDLVIKSWTDKTENREVGSIEDGAIPNIKGTWSMEITGGEANFTGAVQIALDDDGNYKQVDGKSSAPAGSYDYLINFDASAVSDVYKDDVNEVRVKNIALVPAMKY